MQENLDQPTSLSQLLRDSYLAEARAHHRHGESGCMGSPRRLVYGTLKEKPDESSWKMDAHFLDLSAFLSEEELDKSVDLACKAISNEPQEHVDKPDGRPQRLYNVSANKPTLKSEVMSEMQSVQPSVQDKVVRNVRTSREPPTDFKKPLRNTPYGLETQSKKEFLNKAADFIEELSSLFKANSSKRIRPRSCKSHRSRHQNKTQMDGVTYTPVLLSQQMEEPNEFEQQSHRIVEELYMQEVPQELETSSCEVECQAPAVTECTEEPVCEPPHFIQKLKSREVLEGSKVQLECIVRGRPAPEVWWFCEGKELENSPDIQIISVGDQHSLIIAEAFEEDTGRYSCFASNFYGTDSTSAEIYIEGASSSDSDGEQHFQAQHHKRASSAETDVVLLASDTSVEKTAPVPCPERPAPTDTKEAPPIQVIFGPPSVQEETELLSSRMPELDANVTLQAPPTPISQVEPNPQTIQLTVAPPSPPTSQSTNILSTYQQSNLEDRNGSSGYLQAFDLRPIMAAPVFTKNLQDVLAREGQLLVLECRIKGIPSPKVDWYREGTRIDDSPDFRILQKKPRSMAESEEICTLVIAAVFPEDSGTFTCTASNKYGTISSISVVLVKGHNNQNTKSQATSTLLVESSHQKVPVTQLMATSARCKPDVPSQSSMIALDPLCLDSQSSDSLATGTLLQNSLNPNDLAMSLPNLNPLSVEKNHSDTFRSSLPQLDPQSFSVSRPDPLNADSKRKPLSSFTTHFDSGGSDLKSSIEVTQNPPNRSASTIILSNDVESWLEPSQNLKVGLKSTPCPSVISPQPENSSNYHEQPPHKPRPDLPNSCLKTRTEGVSGNHNAQRSSSRVGLRVTFKLPEEEEEEEKSMSCNKEPPPVLAKPKLDPMQLQILQSQVLLEQQQDSISSSPSLSDKTSLESVTPVHQPPNSVLSQLRAPHPVKNSGPIPQLITASIPVQSAAPVSQLSMSSPNYMPLSQLSPLSTLQQNLIPTTLFNSFPQSVVSSSLVHQGTVVPTASQVNIGSTSPMSPVIPVPSIIQTTPSPCPAAPLNIDVPQSNLGPNAPLPLFVVASTTQPNTNLIANTPPFTPSTHILPISITSNKSSVPISEVDITETRPLVTPGAAAVNNTFTLPSLAQPLIQKTNSQNALASLTNVTGPHLVSTPRAPTSSLVSVSPLNPTQVPLPGLIPVSTQSFHYTRPKEFIVAQTLSPIRSPSPTESPVPMLHELTTQIFPKSTRELTSPVSQFAPSQRKFPTRILESLSSPPAYVSSPPLVPPALMNSVFPLRPQSPPQASSPASSSSTPSPIQNPVAFLSSVLPSLPTSPPTNAMGLPKRAPLGHQGVLKKNLRAPRSDDVTQESRETLLKDIEKRLQFKDKPFHFGQQEYKVLSFEQRLMSEIEFRLERTPVEESDDEIQHDEVPTGKCIAPVFDKKLKHFRAMEGVPVTFTCKVVGIPVPKVYWFKDGKQILKKNEHYQKFREGDGTCSLYIKAATNDDDGNYTVMAANPQGRISCSGHLTVQTGPIRNRPMVHSQRVRACVLEVEGEPTQEHFFRPHFLQAPGDMLAHEGKLCRLDCKVSGLPHPELMWLLNGKPIYPDMSHRMLVRENGVHSLVIDPLTQADDGMYTCVASNKAGQSSFCLELRVVEKEMKQAPHFLEKLQNVGVAEGAPVRLDCRVMGMPQPLIYWKKDNDTISHSEERVSMHQDTTGYVCLLIQPAKKKDAGWYTVSAKNEAGIMSCTARLDIYAQWHQHISPAVRRTRQIGIRYAAPTAQDLEVKSAFPMDVSNPVLFSASQLKNRRENEEL